MATADQSRPRAAPSADWRGRLTDWLRRLGWAHHGYRTLHRRRAWLILFLLLLLPFVWDQFALQDRMHRFLPDVLRWLRVTHTLIADPSQPIYTVHPDYLYPPFFLTLFWPLCWVPQWAAAIIFETLKWAALVVSLRCTWRLCAQDGEDVPPIVALGSALLTWRYIWNDFGQGNVNIFILAAAVGGCWLLRRGWCIAAGFVVAIAACVKVTPALLLVYFVYKRQWWTLVGALLAGVIGLYLWPSLWIGWTNNWNLLHDWYGHVISEFVQRGAVSSIHSNQSLTGLLNRLFLPIVAVFKPDAYITIVALPPRLLNAVRLALFACILATLAWVCRGRLPSRRQPLAFATEVGAVLVAMLALSGYSWKMHFVTLIVPLAANLAYLADARFADRPRTAMKWLLVVVFVLCVMTGDILTPRGADYAEAYGAHLWGAFAAAAGLIVIRAQLRRSSDQAPTEQT